MPHVVRCSNCAQIVDFHADWDDIVAIKCSCGTWINARTGKVLRVAGTDPLVIYPDLEIRVNPEAAPSKRDRLKLVQ